MSTDDSHYVDNKPVVETLTYSVDNQKEYTIQPTRMFDRKKFKEDLLRHEGCVLSVYPDPIHGEAALTCGVGHLLQPGDKHYGKPVGTPVTEKEMIEYLEKDMDTAIAGANKLYYTFDNLQFSYPVYAWGIVWLRMR